MARQLGRWNTNARLVAITDRSPVAVGRGGSIRSGDYANRRNQMTSGGADMNCKECGQELREVGEMDEYQLCHPCYCAVMDTTKEIAQ